MSVLPALAIVWGGMPLSALAMQAALPPQAKRDLTVALVGFTSWAAVAWNLSRAESAGSSSDEALMALAASVLCLWPIALGLVLPALYSSLREWLVPAHLAAQHWIGLRFALPPEVQQLLATPSWARGMLPIFLATFSQPWLFLAFGVCLQRTRLRTFLWTQPLLLAPMLWRGRPHCGGQLAAAPEAAAHLQRIAAALQRCSSWLPVGPLRVGNRGDSLLVSSPIASCLAVHFWLVLVLAYCLPSLVIHRLEGQEQQAQYHVRKRQQQRRRQQQWQQQQQADVAGGSSRGVQQQQLGQETEVEEAEEEQTDGSHAGGARCSSGQHERAHAQPQRDLLLQRRQSVLDSAAELLLAGYVAWLLVQLALPMVV